MEAVTHGYQITDSQFWIGLSVILGALGITPFAAIKWMLRSSIKMQMDEGIDKHNEFVDAHASIFRNALDRRRDAEKDTLQIVTSINVRLARIEGKLGIPEGSFLT